MLHFLSQKRIFRTLWELGLCLQESEVEMSISTLPLKSKILDLSRRNLQEYSNKERKTIRRGLYSYRIVGKAVSCGFLVGLAQSRTKAWRHMLARNPGSGQGWNCWAMGETTVRSLLLKQWSVWDLTTVVVTTQMLEPYVLHILIP